MSVRKETDDGPSIDPRTNRARDRERIARLDRRIAQRQIIVEDPSIEIDLKIDAHARRAVLERERDEIGGDR